MSAGGYKVEVLNLQKKVRVSTKRVKEVAEDTLGKTKGKGELNIVLVDNRYIRRLNQKYRRMDRSTDVLSFSQKRGQQKRGQAAFSPRLPRLLGDVVISVEKARSQAREYGHSFKDEMAILIAHGILHLLDYTHAGMKKWGRKK